MWLNWSIAIINATLQLLVIYRLEATITYKANNVEASSIPLKCMNLP